MGEVVGAGLIAHVPTIVLPEATRRELNNGQDTTLVPGLQQLRREVFETLDYDTVVVLDSHWRRRWSSSSPRSTGAKVSSRPRNFREE